MRTNKQETYTNNPNSNLAIPEKPRRIYHFICNCCKEEFETVYKQTQYCPKKTCKSPPRDYISVAIPVLTKAQIESSSKLSRKWLSRKL
jgi:hypothetical protein